MGSQQLPNIVDSPENEEVGEEDIVQITGTVQEFESVTNLEDELGTELDDQIFEDYEGEPVVVAEQIFLTPRAERAGEDVPVSIGDIVDQPEEYFGQTITADGVVAETLEPNAFVLASEDSEQDFEGEDEAGNLINEETVLVVSGGGNAPNLTESQTVQVTGTFQQFELTTVEEETGLDLEDGLYADWEGRPAIIAQQVQQSQ